MNAKEYANLERVEREHWYYAGKRELVRRWLERTAGLSPKSVLLDCGAGTGIFARGMRDLCRVRVLDDHAESLAILRRHFAADEIVEGSVTRIPLPEAACDAVTALDVLEHVLDDVGAVREAHRVLRPGGCMLVTVPALMSLWSDWDEVLHHKRRYTARELCALFPVGEWKIEHWNYTNVAVFPAVWLIRRWQKWRKPTEGRRAEDRLPPPALNRLLQRIFVGLALARRIKFPAGVSLLLIARKCPATAETAPRMPVARRE